MSHSAPALLQEGVYHSQLDQHGKMPVSLFLPQAYEPRYPYPLLVFLHGHGARETQWIEAVPSISRRNYICIGLRGPHAVTSRDGFEGFGWGRDRRCDSVIEDYVFTAVRETMRRVHVHSERIFLAGYCEGAAIAYRLGLAFPDKFAGIVALNGWLPNGPLPPRRFREQTHFSIFIGHGSANTRVAPDKARAAYRLFDSTGLRASLRFYPTDHRIHPSMLRDVDRWIIERTT